MQTFLPDPDFEESAHMLDKRRLGKQRVENLQILQSLFRRRLITEESVETGIIKTLYFDPETELEVPEEELVDGVQYEAVRSPEMKRISLPADQWTLDPTEYKGWQNHPAVKMWEGHEWSLLQYQKAMCDEWVHQCGFKDSCWDKSVKLYFLCHKGEDDTRPPSWLDDEQLHISHQSNLVRKDPEYYRKWFPNVPDDLPYVWPV